MPNSKGHFLFVWGFWGNGAVHFASSNVIVSPSPSVYSVT